MGHFGAVTFLFVHEISREPVNGLAPKNSHGRRVWSLARTSLNVKVNSNVKVARDKKRHFRPFRRPACGLSLVKHLYPLVFCLFIPT